MATLILVRHGRSSANSAGVLAGRGRGVRLDDLGREQAEAAAKRLATLPLARIVSSPLTRCQETARVVARQQSTPPPVLTDARVTECDYGTWSGRPLQDLAKERLWRTVQDHPAAAGFPGGETLAHMAARAVAGVREHDREVTDAHGPEAVWSVVTHGDLVKAVVADALGLHLDLFQRLVVDPGSVSVIRYTPHRPFLLTLNSVDGPLDHLRPPARRARGRRTGDAEVGGGAGPRKRHRG